MCLKVGWKERGEIFSTFALIVSFEAEYHPKVYTYLLFILSENEARSGYFVWSSLWIVTVHCIWMHRPGVESRISNLATVEARLSIGLLVLFLHKTEPAKIEYFCHRKIYPSYILYKRYLNTMMLILVRYNTFFNIIIKNGIYWMYL